MRTQSARLAIAAMMVLGAQTVLAQTGSTDPCAGAGADRCAAPLRSAAYITQIGQANTAMVTQDSTAQTARVRQNGDELTARVTQGGPGVAYLEIDQAGLLNTFVSNQNSADGGGNVAVVAQQGEGNAILLDQSATAGSLNSAMLAQHGNGNQMQLGQNGSDNRAELAQQGDENRMTATQNGSANQLRWIQNGNNLSDLQIVQSGNQAISITQSNGGT